MKFSIGYAQDKITPEIRSTIIMAGGERGRKATGVHDELWVRVLAMKSNRTSCRVLVSCDLFGLPIDMGQAIRKIVNAEVPRAQIVIAATQTQFAPDLIGAWHMNSKPNNEFELYREWLIQQIAETTLRALESLHPVAVRFGMVGTDDLESNLPKADIHQGELLVCQFADPLSLMPEVTLVNLAWNNTLLMKENTLVSSDLPGMLCLALERNVGGAALFFQGGAEKLSVGSEQLRSFLEMQTIAEILAQIAQQSLTQIPWLDDPDFNMVVKEIALPVSQAGKSLEGKEKRWAGIEINEGFLNTRIATIFLEDVWWGCVPGMAAPGVVRQLKQRLMKAGECRVGFIMMTDSLCFFPDESIEIEAHSEKVFNAGLPASLALVKALEEIGKE